MEILGTNRFILKRFELGTYNIELAESVYFLCWLSEVFLLNQQTSKKHLACICHGKREFIQMYKRVIQLN